MAKEIIKEYGLRVGYTKPQLDSFHEGGHRIRQVERLSEAAPHYSIEAEIERTGDNTFYFEVTVVHNDEGGNHYANKWDVMAPDGSLLATRVLHHPHKNEQPFTRSLGGVKIPASIGNVSIRAHDSVHGYGGKIRSVQLPR